MSHHVNAISGRLSLRPPQRHSLEILARITEISPLKKDADSVAALEVIQSEYPSVTDFEGKAGTLFDQMLRCKINIFNISKINSEVRGGKAPKIKRLLRVEHADEPTEIVIHVNMLKEGWDVTNLYTIVPLRAANARILIEQSIGRGLRLPYGKRVGVTAVDRLNIVAHDTLAENMSIEQIGA